MKGSTPKQFLLVDEIPVLRMTIEKFIKACPDIRIVTVLPPAYMERWRNYCIGSSFHHPQVIVAGGITRFHSVRNALEKIPAGAVVAIHDGVRPLVSVELLSRMFLKMETARALIPVVPSVDTLRALRKDENGNFESLEGVCADRSCIFAVQTPQMFRSEDIKKAYSRPYDTSFTDDASVADAAGIPLSFIEGERYNIKITEPADLEVARRLTDL